MLKKLEKIKEKVLTMYKAISMLIHTYIHTYIHTIGMSKIILEGGIVIY